MRRMHISSLFDQLSMQIFYFDRGLKMQICACLIGGLKQARLPPCQTRFSLNDIHSILSYIVVPPKCVEATRDQCSFEVNLFRKLLELFQIGGRGASAVPQTTPGNKTKQKSIFLTSCSFILIVFCITAANCQMREMGLTSITMFSENIFQLMSVIVLRNQRQWVTLSSGN